MNMQHVSITLVKSLALLLALSTASPNSWAVFVYFDGSTSTDFNVASNWTPENAPGSNTVDVYGIDDGLSSTFNGGNVRINGLRVGSAAKEHQVSPSHFGRLTMTTGTLEVIGSGAAGLFGIGREREPVIMDDNNKGGELIMTGDSIIRANGLIVGERTHGLLSIGQDAFVDLKAWVFQDEPPIIGPHFSIINTEDIRIGNYGRAFDDFGSEPGLDGRGLVDVQGTLNANFLYVSENGAKGEIRLSGGTVNLNGALIMSFCEKCVLPNTPANMALLALQSSKVSIIGSGGSFKVGLDADPVTPDPSLIVNSPFSRDLRFNREGGAFGHPVTATFSFTADAEGVTPITVVDNGLDSSGTANLSGTAYIDGAKLELNLDAYTSTSPLTLIDAAPGHLHSLDEFGTVTFLGSRTADVHYDYVNGDVYLDNFQGDSPGTPGDFDGDGDVDGRDFLLWQRGGSPSPRSATDLAAWQANYGPGGLAAVSSVPEPSAWLLTLVASGTMGLSLQRRKR